LMAREPAAGPRRFFARLLRDGLPSRLAGDSSPSTSARTRCSPPPPLVWPPSRLGRPVHDAHLTTSGPLSNDLRRRSSPWPPYQWSADATARLLRAAALEGPVGRVTSAEDIWGWTPTPAPHQHTAAVLRLEPGATGDGRNPHLGHARHRTSSAHHCVGVLPRGACRRRSTYRTCPVAPSWRSRVSWH
jgi:hypothetical protein